MEQPLWTQGSRFLLAVALGAAYGLHYDLLRGLRRNLRWLTPLLDLWFVLSWLVGNLLFGLYAGDGQFRIYMLVGSLLGSAAYFLTLSRLILPLFSKMWEILSWPFRMLGRLGKKFFIFLKKNYEKHLFICKKIGYNKETKQQKYAENRIGRNERCACANRHSLQSW